MTAPNVADENAWPMQVLLLIVDERAIPVAGRDIMSHFAFVFGAIGRLRAIELALHYDLRAAKAERENVVVPVEVWAAMTNAWNFAKGRPPIYPMQPIAVQQ